MAAETSLSNIMLAALQGFRACLSRSDFRQPALLRFTEPTQVDPPRMSIVSIDTELLFRVVKREIDVVQIVSPFDVFMATFEVCQRLQRDPVPGEVGHYVGDEHGPLARSLDSVRQRRNWVRPPARIQSFCFPGHLPTVTTVPRLRHGQGLAFRDAIGPRVPDLSRGAAGPGNSGKYWWAAI